MPTATVFPVQGGASWSDTWGAPRSGGRRHEGQDLFASLGTPVVAVAPGKAVPGLGGLGGITVTVHHGDGYRTYYAHLKDVTVVPNQQVNAGDVLGHVGTTGNAKGTSPHLHFGLYNGSTAHNPAPMLKGLAQAPASSGGGGDKPLIDLPDFVPTPGDLKLPNPIAPLRDGIEGIADAVNNLRDPKTWWRIGQIAAGVAAGVAALALLNRDLATDVVGAAVAVGTKGAVTPA